MKNFLVKVLESNLISITWIPYDKYKPLDTEAVQLGRKTPPKTM